MDNEIPSIQELIALAKNPSYEQRRTLLDSIISVFLSRCDTLTLSQIEIFGEIISSLLISCPPEIQEQTALNLSRIVKAPRNVVLQLAHSEYQIAQHLLENSKVLDEHDLILIAENSTQEHLRSIARRANLGLRVQIVILQKGDQSAVDELTSTLDKNTNTTKILKLRANNGFNFKHPDLQQDMKSA